MDIQPLYEEFSMSKYMNAAHRDENLLITIQTLRAKVASADDVRDAERYRTLGNMATKDFVEAAKICVGISAEHNDPFQSMRCANAIRALIKRNAEGVE